MMPPALATQWCEMGSRGHIALVIALCGTASAGSAQPRVTIDAPVVSRVDPILISGYAYDPRATLEPGIAELQVWAFPKPDAEGVFLGNATLGLDRSQVAADLKLPVNFAAMGYELAVSTDALSPGPYEVRALARSSIDGRVESASTRVMWAEALSQVQTSSRPSQRIPAMEEYEPPASGVRGTRWGVDALKIPSAGEGHAFVVVANTSDFVASITLEITYRDNSAKRVRTFTIHPRSRLGISVGGEFAEGLGRVFTAVVTSKTTSDGTARIIVESRTGYGNAWATGSNAPANCLAECAPR
jgi:hypothetical protein